MEAQTTSIMRMWVVEGVSDIDIARQTGLSRERVRQIRTCSTCKGIGQMRVAEGLQTCPDCQGSGGWQRDWERPTRLAKELGVSQAAIKRWTLKRWVTPSKSGLIKREETVSTRDRLLSRPCDYPDCDDPIESIIEKARFCEKHRALVNTYRYPTLNPEQRARFRVYLERYKDKKRQQAS